jgi:hypothetical protein
MSSARTTTNHDEICKTVETRSGLPAIARSIERRRQPGGLLRIDYDEPAGCENARMHRISWDKILKSFDRNEPALLCDPDGDSLFGRFVEKESTGG